MGNWKLRDRNKSPYYNKCKMLIETKDLEGISKLNSKELQIFFKTWWYEFPAKFGRCKGDLAKTKKDFPAKYKVSFCTNIMGRLDELKATLFKNIKDNMDYPYFEYVLLNYDGDCKVDEYIKSEFMPYIESGILSYYKNLEPAPYYKMCHSRNITGKLADGDIISFNDANNLTNDFAYFLNGAPQHLENEDIICMMGGNRNGRIAIFKDKFLALGGYDESMDPRWWQDRDLEYRAEASGLTNVLYSKLQYYNPVGNKNWSKDKQYANYPDELKSIFKRVGRRRRYIWKLRQQTASNIVSNNLVANKDVKWGNGSFLKNFIDIKKV